MKKSFLKIFIVISICFVFFNFNFFLVSDVFVSQAQTSPTSINASQAGNAIGSEISGASKTDVQTVQKASGAVAQASTGSAENDDNFFTNGLQAMFLSIILGLAKLVSILVSGAGWIYDNVLSKTTEIPKDLDTVITNAWKIVRDLANIVIVFSLLYVGIKTILDGQGFADKKILTSVIIAAILINFSLTFTKLAFDVSNTIGKEILVQTQLSSTSTSSTSSGKDSTYSYSGAIMGLVKPQKVFETAGFKNESVSEIAESDTVGWGFVMTMAAQMLLLAGITIALAFIFIGVSITLVYRFITFIFLMVLSPVGVMSRYIPWLKKHGSEWFDSLKKQTLYFPIFTFLLYIVIYFVSTVATSTKGIDLTSTDTIFSFLYNFLLIIGFLISLLILPGKIGASGAEMMTSVGNWGKQKIKSVPISLTARAGRQVGGRLIGGGLTNSKLLKNTAQKDNMFGSVARATLRGADKMKNATYDVRNTESGKKLNLGTGITNWSDAVSAKSKKLAENKEKEMKLYGFDKMTEEQKKENAAKVAVEEGKRNKIGKELETHKSELKAAQLAGKSEAEIKAITDIIADKEKDLEKAEIEVGKIKNQTDTNYFEIMKTRQKRWTIMGKGNAMHKEALEKTRKEMEGKWKESGKYVADKKKKGSVGSTSTSIGSGGGTVTI